MRSAKARTIKAWVVVCADGHECHGIVARRFKSDALWLRNNSDGRFPCGPHTVVALTGTFQPKREAARKGKR